ncbi:MAG: hypothetical protein AAFP04_08925 [Myxococcota bacterium]
MKHCDRIRLIVTVGALGALASCGGSGSISQGGGDGASDESQVQAQTPAQDSAQEPLPQGSNRDENQERDPEAEALITPGKPFNTSLRWEPTKPESESFQATVQQLLRQCEAYPERLDDIQVLEAFLVEGLSGSDPMRQPSEVVRRELDEAVVASAYCVYFADRAVSDLNQAALERLLRRVFDTYVGGTNADLTTDNDDPGNPINEQYILPIVFLIDFLAESMAEDLWEDSQAFATQLNQRIDAFMTALGPNDNRRKNNWAMTALTTRYFSMRVAKEDESAVDILDDVEALIAENLEPPSDFELSSCENLASIGAYGSFDLQRRDAFRYHTPVFYKAFWLVVLADGLAPDTMDLLESAYTVLEPYVSGVRVHQEFVCSQVELDRVRAEAGDPGFSGPYDPLTQKYVYRWGRIALPSSQAWTAQFMSESYKLWDLLVLTGKE